MSEGAKNKRTSDTNSAGVARRWTSASRGRASSVRSDDSTKRAVPVREPSTLCGVYRTNSKRREASEVPKPAVAMETCLSPGGIQNHRDFMSAATQLHIDANGGGGGGGGGGSPDEHKRKSAGLTWSSRPKLLLIIFQQYIVSYILGVKV